MRNKQLGKDRCCAESHTLERGEDSGGRVSIEQSTSLEMACEGRPGVEVSWEKACGVYASEEINVTSSLLIQASACSVTKFCLNRVIKK